MGSPSGETGDPRFRVVYGLRCGADEAAAVAEEICVEQTIEFPTDLLEDLERGEEIRREVVGRVESLRELGDGHHELVVSYALAIVASGAGVELTQLLNVLFGNVSLLPALRLERLELPAAYGGLFRGPRFGREGLRERVGVPDRALLCGALKPMGLRPEELAHMARSMARGGVDVIKDDHGLADQPFCPFEARVLRCAAAVAAANRETGHRCLYAPNVTAPFDELLRRARFAREAGAGALLVAPGLAGFDALRALAADDAIDLPLISHPAFQGSFVQDPHAGASHEALFGQLGRLAGADAAIFPHLGGRFRFSAADCRAVVRGCTAPMAGLRPILPAPAGGMSLARVPEMRRFYGDDMLLLVGGDLRRHGPDLAESCRRFIARLGVCS